MRFSRAGLSCEDRAATCMRRIGTNDWIKSNIASSCAMVHFTKSQPLFNLFSQILWMKTKRMHCARCVLWPGFFGRISNDVYVMYMTFVDGTVRFMSLMNADLRAACLSFRIEILQPRLVFADGRTVCLLPQLHRAFAVLWSGANNCSKYATGWSGKQCISLGCGSIRNRLRQTISCSYSLHRLLSSTCSGRQKGMAATLAFVSRKGLLRCSLPA